MIADATLSPSPASPVIDARKARRRQWLMVLAIILSSLPTAFVVLAFPVANWLVNADWREFRAEWEAKGEIFTVEALADTEVADPAANFAKAPIIEEIYLHDASRREASLSADHEGHAHPGAPEPAASTPAPLPMRLETLDLFAADTLRQPSPKPPLAYLSGQPVPLAAYLASSDASATAGAAQRIVETFVPHEATVDELLSAAERPEAWFAALRSIPHARPQAHMTALVNALHALRLRNLALIEAEAEPAAIGRSLASTLRLIRHGTDCPGIPALTIRTLALESAGLEPVWQALYRRRLDDAAWQRVDAELASDAFGSRLLPTLRYERAVLVGQVEDLYQSRRAQPFSAPPAWVQLADLREYAALTQRYWFASPGGSGALAERPRIDQLELVEGLVADLPANQTNSIVAAGLLPVAEFARHAQRIEISRDHARVAIALERHRLAEGRYPDTLSALVPRWLPELPANAETGHPPRYEAHPEGNGYRLRDLGTEGAGDGPEWLMPPPVVTAPPPVGQPS